MGNQCKQSTDKSTYGSQYSLIQKIDHPAFGEIYHLKSQANHLQVGVKIIKCENQQIWDSFKKKIELAKEYDNSIPTLVQIYDYEIIQADNKQKRKQILEKFEKENDAFNCLRSPFPIILIHFQYFSPQQTLSQIIIEKNSEIQKFLSNKIHKNVSSEVKDIKFCDYSKIDKLNSAQRQFVNIYYQQIQILRMIDHIIGAVFFLNHYEIEHSAIRSSNIIVDDEGKYILVDRQLFQKPTNYQLAYNDLNEQFTKYQRSSMDKFEYLSPQMLNFLKNKERKPFIICQKSDIFAVGLLALEMALLSKNLSIYEFSKNNKSVKFVESQLTKRLVRVKQKYSQDFINLLQKMLKVDPNQRISFEELIDELNPILTKNLEAVRRIYSIKEDDNGMYDTFKNSFVIDEKIEKPIQKFNHQNFTHDQCEKLKSKLVKIEAQFQKVMKSKMLTHQSSINQDNIKREQSRILSKLSQLKAYNNELGFFNPQNTWNPPSSNQSNIVKKNNLNNSLKVSLIQNQASKRQMSGNDLYQLYWKEYEQIRSSRPEFK